MVDDADELIQLSTDEGAVEMSESAELSDDMDEAELPEKSRRPFGRLLRS